MLVPTTFRKNIVLATTLKWWSRKQPSFWRPHCLHRTVWKLDNISVLLTVQKQLLVLHLVLFLCHWWKNPQNVGNRGILQFDGSKDDLDWRIDFKYFNFIYFIQKLRSMKIKSCSFAWICELFSFFNLWLDFISTSFFIHQIKLKILYDFGLFL